MTHVTVVHEPGRAPYSMCACGARGDVVEYIELGDPQPTWIPAQLHEPCTCPPCPRCCFCERLLDNDSRCENLNCLYVGLHILAGA